MGMCAELKHETIRPERLREQRKSILLPELFLRVPMRRKQTAGSGALAAARQRRERRRFAVTIIEKNGGFCLKKYNL